MFNMKRRKYLIDKRFQFKFILYYARLLIFSVILLGAILWFSKENSIWLLPDNASLLYQVNVAEGIPLKKIEQDRYQKDYSGTKYYPISKISDSNGKSRKAKYNSFDLYTKPLLLVTFLNIFLIIFFSILFSHRIAGPIYKIKSQLREYQTGKKINPITLREKDFLKDLAEVINETIIEKNKKQ